MTAFVQGLVRQCSSVSLSGLMLAGARLTHIAPSPVALLTHGHRRWIYPHSASIGIVADGDSPPPSLRGVATRFDLSRSRLEAGAARLDLSDLNVVMEQGGRFASSFWDMEMRPSTPNLATNFKRLWLSVLVFGGLDQPRLIWPMLPLAAMMDFGNAVSIHGISPQVSCWFAKLAVLCLILPRVIAPFIAAMLSQPIRQSTQNC